MAGLWDSVMKRLVKHYGKHFATWLSADAVFMQSLDVELKYQQFYADALLEAMINITF